MAISGLTLSAQFTDLLSRSEIFAILSNSPYDSILIERISFYITNLNS